VSTSFSVSMSAVVTSGMVRGATVGIRLADFEGVFVLQAAGWLVQMTVVQIVSVIPVQHRCVSTSAGMLMVVIAMDVGSHFYSSGTVPTR
jgi:hypothetical protein